MTNLAGLVTKDLNASLAANAYSRCPGVLLDVLLLPFFKLSACQLIKVVIYVAEGLNSPLYTKNTQL